MAFGSGVVGQLDDGTQPGQLKACMRARYRCHLICGHGMLMASLGTADGSGTDQA